MKRILFVTGTRADFGKLKPLMLAVSSDPSFEAHVFVTGMHMLGRYGNTVNEVLKAGFQNVHTFMNQHEGDAMEMVLANTVQGLSRLVRELRPDLLVVHGDRGEALAGAIVGALTNTLVGHIEGGERSGTVDELIRHAVSKLAHLHFVANEEARLRLIQMGELPSAIYAVGSPDIDVMLSTRLPSLAESRVRYELDFDDYGIVLFHPVTTAAEHTPERAAALVDALLASAHPFIVIHPNNDLGADAIFAAYRRLDGRAEIRRFPSLAFEHFLTLLRHARVLVGNSSAGVREAPVYGVPSVNVGDRQDGRHRGPTIVQSGHDAAAIAEAIEAAWGMPRAPVADLSFGSGDSTPRFMRALSSAGFWATPRQKSFCDVPSLGAVRSQPREPLAIPAE